MKIIFVKIAILILSSLFLLSCKDHNDKLAKVVEALPVSKDFHLHDFDELKAMASQTALDPKLLEHFFQGSELLSKDGEYFEGFSFDIFPVTHIEAEKKVWLLLWKKFQALDGSLSHIYLVEYPVEGKSGLIEKVGAYADAAECATTSEIRLKEGTFMAQETESCYNEDPETGEAGFADLIKSAQIDLNVKDAEVKRKSRRDFRVIEG